MPRASSHAALMRWRKDDLAELATDNARKLGARPPAIAGLDKRALAHLIMDQARRLSVREAMQGE